MFCDRCALNQPYYVVAQEEQMTSLRISAMLVWSVCPEIFEILKYLMYTACFFLPCLPNTILWPCIAISYNSLIWAFNVADETSIACPYFQSLWTELALLCSIRCSSAFDDGNESKKKRKACKREFNGEAKVFVPILKVRTLKMHHMVDMQGDQFFFTVVLIVAWSHDFKCWW